MINLTEWYLERLEGYENPYFIAWGIVYGHPRIPDGINIHTNVIRSLKLNDTGNSLLMHTKSGNDYELPLSEALAEYGEKTKDCLEAFNIPATVLSDCEKLKEISEKEMIAKVEKILEPNELYLLQCGVVTKKAYFEKADGEILQIPVMCHSGMRQDSYLVTDFRMGTVDFRYWDKPRGVEPYHWSDGLEAIKIENIGKNDMVFYADTEIICKVNEVTTIESTQYHGEGLLSPDAVNGKSALDDVELD